MKKRKDKYFLLCSIVMMLCLNSCEGGGKDVSQNTNDSIETTNIVIEHNVESNPSVDNEILQETELVNYLTFTNNKFELPCLVNDLTFLEIDDSTLVSSIGYTVGNVKYDNLNIGKVFLNQLDDDKELGERMIVGIEISVLSAYEYSGVTVDYNGITINDTKEKLIRIMGEPDSAISTNSRLSYLLDKNNTEQYVTFQINTLDKEPKIEAIGLYIQ